MVKTQTRCFVALLLAAAVCSAAQENNTVPLDHAAYDIIAMGIMQGVILSPHGAKPWPVYTVKQKLREMLNNPSRILTVMEEETVFHALDSLERKSGLELNQGRYRAEGDGFTFETGLGWESSFSVDAPGASIASVNMAKAYAGGDAGDFVSWNVAAWGGLLYIEREQHGLPECPAYTVPSAFSYVYGKQWDGGVLSLRNPAVYAGWPDDPALAYGLEGEVNGVFFDRRLQLRMGRVRRDWGHGPNGTSLFLNAHSRPFAAVEGTFLPLSWLNISFLGGALEHFREDGQQPSEGPFSNILSAAQIEFTPLPYIYLGIGGTAVMLRQFNAALFSNLELRLPGLFALWGGIFVDRLNPSSENFYYLNDNRFAYQAGIRAIIHWLPLAAFTLRYAKIEPYCYTGNAGATGSAFINGGESLGHYLPPNSDELLLRLESMLFPSIKAHIQFQMIRHGADYGYGAVGGSSLYDILDDDGSVKYFLMDGVYQWDNIFKLGGSFSLKAAGLPISVYVETGFATTNFTINGKAGIGKEADYEQLPEDPVYRGRSSFVFSVGFRLFQ